MPSLFREHPDSIPRFSPARFPPRSAASSRIAPVPSTLVGGDSYKKPQSGHRRQCGEVYPYFALRFTARKPDSEKVCIARGSSISRFSNADRRVSGRIRTAGSLERHQLGRTGSATLTLENNREYYSCSRAEGRLKQRPRPLSTALLARKFQRAKGTKAKGLTACSPLA